MPLFYFILGSKIFPFVPAFMRIVVMSRKWVKSKSSTITMKNFEDTCPRLQLSFEILKCSA